MMHRFPSRSTTSLLLIAASVFLGAPPARGQFSPAVVAAFKGKVLVSTAPLSPAADDKATIAKFKKQSTAQATGAMNADKVWGWKLNYLGFLQASAAGPLKVVFYSGTRAVADKSVQGPSASTMVLDGDVWISEDDGLVKGNTYTIKIVSVVRGKQVVLATSAAVVFK